MLVFLLLAVYGQDLTPDYWFGGYCSPNTEASRIGGYTRHWGYKDEMACYRGRCANDNSCVAATYGHGECIAYKQCDSKINDPSYTTLKRKYPRRQEGYCNPNFEASRIGGYNKHPGYKDMAACYLGRCFNDHNCIAATYGHGDCIAYKQCDFLTNDWFYTTMKKPLPDIGIGYCSSNCEACRIGGYNTHPGYKDLATCYLGRCAKDDNCVAATYGHGDCIAYRECVSLKWGWPWLTMQKSNRRRVGDQQLLKAFELVKQDKNTTAMN